MPVREQALRFGWSNGGPRTQELSDPERSHHGPEWIRQRYADTNFWFGVAVDMARELNPELAEKLTEYRKRNPNEPVGYFEPESVPDTHVKEKSPMGGLYGYAIPRVMIEGFGRGDSRTDERILKTLGILGEVLPTVDTPAEFLAALSSEVVITMHVLPVEVLSHILPAGLLEEDNCRSDFRELVEQLEEKAPYLWGVYKFLGRQVRDDYGIASL